MRRKIQEIIRGNFDYDRPSMKLAEDALDFSVTENETYSGAFHLISSSEEPIRGIVTCEHPNVEILTPEFDAAEAEIRFEFSGEQVTERETEKGIFVVTSSSGEYLFPFFARISRHYIPSSIGKIKTLNDFTNLCKLNWQEALTVFSSRYFCNIFHEDAEYESLLYHSLTRQRHGSHELEEFLIAAGKKQRSQFSVDKPKRTYFVRDKAVQAAVDVMKSEWGYCDIRISCEEPFVLLGKNRIRMEDFVGKHAEFDFQLDPHRMHGGKNYAEIILDDGFGSERMVLTCILKSRQPEQMKLSFVSEDDLEDHSYSWKKRRCYYLLEKSFLSYNLQKKSENDWIKESIQIIQKAEEGQIQSRWLNMFLAYLYWKADDREHLTECILSVPRNTKTARTPLGAMYQFLLVLSDPETDREEAYARIRMIYARYRSHPILTWIVLQMDESLARNPQRKYQWIREYMMEYSMSPIFYLEAARILQLYPEILNSQDDFDFHLICWMSKKNLITKELALRIQGMTQAQRSFSKNYFRVFCKCYKKLNDDSFVRTICVYLINTSRYGETYFPWFKRGVEQHLKIAGLYEAYMLSWSRSMGELPQEVVRYFSMNSSLPARKKAMLFAYIVRNKNRLQRDWPSYMVMVKNFALSELKKDSMNDDLAIIYEELRRMMTVKEWDQVKRDAENCYKVYIGDNRFFAVQVCQGTADAETRRTVISGNSTYIYLRKRPYVILYEAPDGRLYAAADGCRVSKVLPGNSLYGPDGGAGTDRERDSSRRSPQTEAERLARMEGPIDDMADLLLKAEEKELPVIPAAQQLMIRMLFTGYLGEKHEEVFRILKDDPESEELLLAYVSVISRSFMLSDYPLSGSVYHFLGDRLKQKKRLNEYCTAAFLRMHLRYNEKKYDACAEQILKAYLFNGIYFPFYSELSKGYRRRYLLTGISVISWQEREGQTFYLEFSDGTRESLREVLPGWYTYPVCVLPGEICEYSIVDVQGQLRVRESIRGSDINESAADTRYGQLGTVESDRTDTKAQYAYAKMCDMVNALFAPIKE
ncbi:MAG: DUF5717 family protein [Clostridiales bacterium]|nr:DUF5717 family protein [Clostridiales bacterium]